MFSPPPRPAPAAAISVPATLTALCSTALCLVALCCLLVTAIPGRAAAPGLLEEGIAQQPCDRDAVVGVPVRVRGAYQADSGVLRTAGGFYPRQGRPRPALDACARASQRAARRWLSDGVIPGRGPLMRSMAARALLDLRLLQRPDGAIVAGWQPQWRYAWPRDSSWAAAALAGTGHGHDALRILRFLQRVQLADGTWAARYWPGGSGPVRDGRPGELDAVGWVPWAVWSWLAAAPPGGGAVRQLVKLWPMVEAAADAADDSLTPVGLPRASMDYWEDSVQVTLGTCAPLLAGLRSAADIARTLGMRAQELRWARAAARLSAGIDAAFGRFGYDRLPYGRSGPEAAVTFLGPPFAPAGTRVGRAVEVAERALAVPGGGLRPGAYWPGNAATAWTAETAFFALYQAETGRYRAAGQILDWLAAHRTRLSELPEQVTDGHPASVAPLAWTDAVVLLALLAQGHHLPTVPVPVG